MEDGDKETLRDTERTTIIQTDRDSGGGSGAVVAILVLLVLGVLLYLVFGGGLGGLSGGGDEGDVNINIDTPEMTMPDVEMPDVNVTLPETAEGDGNRE